MRHSLDRDLFATSLLILSLVAFPLLLSAQQPRGELVATRRQAPPTIDGLLSEGEWSGKGASLRQQAPSFGSAPSQPTSVWIAYDDRAIYVAARMFDRDPSGIVRNIGRRDAEVPSDWFEISFDPQRDRRNGYYFRVTAAGGILDGAITSERQRDGSWNANWTSAVAIDARGWSVEIEIPLSELRFSVRDQQIWGVNAARWIHRATELSTLALSPVTVEGSVAYYADLKGLSGIVPPSRLELLPYALGRLHLYEPVADDPLNDGNDLSADAGLDLNYTTSAGTRLAATFNPDFGQVEVDPASINLTTFETTYPEKRPFFTEGAAALKFGEGATEFFYSRRIGRGIQPRSVGAGSVDFPDRARILGAVRLTAKPADDATLGLLAAVTGRGFAEIDSSGVRRSEEVEPLAVYAVAREQQQFSDGLYGLGFFAGGMGRDLRTERLEESMNSRTFAGGVDGWWYLDTGRSWAIRGLGGFSHVGGSRRRITALQNASQRYYGRPDAGHLEIDSAATSLSGWIGKLGLTRQAGSLVGNVSVTATSPGFELNDIGILRQADRIAASASIDHGWYEPDELFLSRSIGVSASHDVDFDGVDVGSSASLYGSAQFANAWGAAFSLSHYPSSIDTRATRGGPTILGPSGWSGVLSAYTDDLSGIMVWADLTGSTDSEGGESIGYGGGISWRPTEGLSLTLEPWVDRSHYPTTYHDRFDDSLAAGTYGTRYIFAGLRQSGFSTDIRLNWTPTPDISLQLYLQPYVGRASYERYKQLRRAGSNLYDRFGEGSSELQENDGEYLIDPDGEGPAPSFSLYNSDFIYRSLRGTISLGWEYLPGSSLYLVWTQLRSTYEDYWTPEGRKDRDPIEAYPDDSLVLKISYLLAW